MKSYLNDNPVLRLALNEDLAIGQTVGNAAHASVLLDDCNFHESVDLTEFNDFKLLTIHPPDGEFTVMNYRINSEFAAPFRIFPFLDKISAYKLELLIKVRACFPDAHYGANVKIAFKVPRDTTGVNLEVPPTEKGQTAEYNDAEKTAVWSVIKFKGGVEHMLKASISTSSD